MHDRGSYAINTNIAPEVMLNKYNSPHVQFLSHDKNRNNRIIPFSDILKKEIMVQKEGIREVLLPEQTLLWQPLSITESNFAQIIMNIKDIEKRYENGLKHYNPVSNEEYSIRGIIIYPDENRARLVIPGLEEKNFRITRQDTEFIGKVRARVDIPGVSGSIKLNIENGKVNGVGNVIIHEGENTVTLKIEDGRINEEESGGIINLKNPIDWINEVEVKFGADGSIQKRVILPELGIEGILSVDKNITGNLVFTPDIAGVQIKPITVPIVEGAIQSLDTVFPITIPGISVGEISMKVSSEGVEISGKGRLNINGLEYKEVNFTIQDMKLKWVDGQNATDTLEGVKVNIPGFTGVVDLRIQDGKLIIKDQNVSIISINNNENINLMLDENANLRLKNEDGIKISIPKKLGDIDGDGKISLKVVHGRVSIESEPLTINQDFRINNNSLKHKTVHLVWQPHEYGCFEGIIKDADGIEIGGVFVREIRVRFDDNGICEAIIHGVIDIPGVKSREINIGIDENNNMIIVDEDWKKVIDENDENGENGENGKNKISAFLDISGVGSDKEIELELKDGGLTGSIEISKEKLQFIPGITLADSFESLKFQIEKGKIIPVENSGSVIVKLGLEKIKGYILEELKERLMNMIASKDGLLPGIFVDAYGRVGFAMGKDDIKLDLPWFDKAEIDHAYICYKCGNLVGGIKVNVGKAIGGVDMTGGFEIEIVTKDSRVEISGKGRLEFKQGDNFYGYIDVAFTPEGEFYGQGEATYDFKVDWLKPAKLKFFLEKDGHFWGIAEICAEKELYKGTQGNKQIFKFHNEFPLFSVGPIIIIMEIGGEGNVKWWIDPVLLMGRIDATYNKKNKGEFEFSGDVAITGGAGTGIMGSVYGGVGASLVGLASVNLGAQLEGMAGIDGDGAVGVNIEYKEGQFSMSGNAMLSVLAEFRFAIDAYLRAQIGKKIFGRFIGYKYERWWDIYDYRYVPGWVGTVNLDVFYPPSNGRMIAWNYTGGEIDGQGLTKKTLRK